MNYTLAFFPCGPSGEGTEIQLGFQVGGEGLAPTVTVCFDHDESRYARYNDTPTQISKKKLPQVPVRLPHRPRGDPRPRHRRRQARLQGGRLLPVLSGHRLRAGRTSEGCMSRKCDKKNKFFPVAGRHHRRPGWIVLSGGRVHRPRSECLPRQGTLVAELRFCVQVVPGTKLPIYGIFPEHPKKRLYFLRLLPFTT